MTCQQFRAKAGTDPRTMTRAERSASFRHYESCPSCERWFQRRRRRLDRLGVRSVLTDEEAGELADQDIADPEY